MTRRSVCVLECRPRGLLHALLFRDGASRHLIRLVRKILQQRVLQPSKVHQKSIMKKMLFLSASATSNWRVVHLGDNVISYVQFEMMVLFVFDTETMMNFGQLSMHASL